MDRKIYGLLASVAGIALAQSAVAQDTGNAADAEAPTVGQDIVVTAQRRDEKLSKTPVAVAVISSDTLAKANIASEEDLRTATPGLSVRTTTSSNQLNFSLRGQSQDAFSGTRPGVLPYVNEVQVPGSGASVFYDLGSVQVLKGPQGTLFGRSATGGAVLYTTQKPTDEFEGHISALYGTYNHIKVDGAINIPLVKDGKISLRLAGFYEERNGFQRNVEYGGREGDIKRFGARASLTIAPTDRIRNELVYDYFDTDSENTVAVISGLLPFTGAPPPFIPIEFLYAGINSPVAIATGVGTIQAFTGGVVPPAQTTAFYNAYFNDPTKPDGGIRDFLRIQNARGPFRVGADSNNIFIAQNHIFTNRTIFELSDNIELRNIFGYSRVRATLGQEADGTPYGISQSGRTNRDKTGIVQDNDQVSNEIQLVGDAIDGRLDFVTGFYYAKEKRIEKQFSAFFDLLFGGATQRNEYIIRSETKAGYAQGTFAITDSGLSVTVGARYTSEDVGKETLPDDVFRVALGERPVLPGVNYDQKANYNNWSYQLGIQQQIDDLLLYVVHRRAFKSGGFNTTLVPLDATAEFGGDIYRDERVQDVEFGAKFAGLLGTTPARANLAVYKTFVNNSQRTAYSVVLGNPASLTVNIPKGTVLGAELDGSFDPAQWLRLGGSFNYTDAKYTNGNIVANSARQIFDIVPDTPKYSGTAFAEITVPASADMNVVLHGNVYGQTKSFTTPRSANSFGTRIEGYLLANFRIGLENDASGWSVTANLKNAFNKAYFAGGLPTGEIYQINTLIPGEPRTFTIQARFKF